MLYLAHVGYLVYCELLVLADLPVLQILLIAIINGGTQWVCVLGGGGGGPPKNFQNVYFLKPLRFFKNFMFLLIPIRLTSEKLKFKMKVISFRCIDFIVARII